MTDEPLHPPTAPPQCAEGNPPEDSTRTRLLHEYLAAFHEPCPSCGYELHALTGRQCPECGQTLVVRVGLEHPNLASFVVGLIGLSAAAGFGGLFLVFVVAMTVFRGGMGGPAAEVMATFFGIALVSSVLTVVWVRRSGRIRRAERSTRMLLAAMCWAYAALTLVVVYIFLGAP